MKKHMRLVLGLSMLPSVAGADDFHILPNPQSPLPTGTFQCTIKDGRSLNDAGELKPDEMSKWFRERYRELTFDAATGEFSSSSTTTHWVVLRAGDTQWDLIAHLPGRDPVYNILRIEVWNAPMRFTMTDGNDFFSGLCEGVGS